MNKSLHIQSVHKKFASAHILKDINLEVERGEFIVMVGPSGCGKSTLLRTIAGLEPVTHGRMMIAGRDVTRLDPFDRGIAMVFQSYALYPHMTVHENMGFGLRMAGRPPAEVGAAVERAAQILRITDQLQKKPRQLSGGQRQRVAIGRAITRSPEIFLFDEPLSNLDAALRTQMRVELSALHAELGSTMIYVTHDQVEAMTMASRIVVMNAGQIQQVGSPLELYHRPASLFVAGFLGAPRMNFLEVQLIRQEGSRAIVSAPGLDPIALLIRDGIQIAAGSTLTLGIRPEKLRIGGPAATDDVWTSGQIRLVEQLGRETIVYVDASPLQAINSESGTGNLTAQIGSMTHLKAGENVTLSFSPHHAYLFAADGQTLSAFGTQEAQ
ncbi:MAG: ABC transporter ATP-binding protein [Comamonas sp.]